jgi:two-component system, chemotaxis family, CheB/CheR fusion protein
MELFNFALRDEGYLFLGSSESVDNFPALFSAVDRKHRIYKCLPVGAQHRFWGNVIPRQAGVGICRPIYWL